MLFKRQTEFLSTKLNQKRKKKEFLLNLENNFHQNKLLIIFSQIENVKI